MKRLIVSATALLVVAGCTGPEPTPSPTETSASPTPTVTVTASPEPSPTETTPPPPPLEDWPWEISEVADIALGDTFKAISSTTGDAINPCSANDDAFFAIEDGWVLGVRGQGKGILDEGGYISQTATVLALIAVSEPSGPLGPVGPAGLQLGSDEAQVTAALPGAEVTTGAGATLYTTQTPDGTSLTVEVTEGTVTRIAVSDAPLTAGVYSPVC